MRRRVFVGRVKARHWSCSRFGGCYAGSSSLVGCPCHHPSHAKELMCPDGNCISGTWTADWPGLPAMPIGVPVAPGVRLFQSQQPRVPLVWPRSEDVTQRGTTPMVLDTTGRRTISAVPGRWQVCSPLVCQS
jgi:hypothetical protein